jgi:hypothetical protein
MNTDVMIDMENLVNGIQNVYRTLRNCTFNDGTYIEPFKDWKKRG